MDARPVGAPDLRAPTLDDFRASLRAGLSDFAALPGIGLMFASAYVFIGWGMAWITWRTGTTYWLVLATLGFPLIGAFAALGFYETSRRRMDGEPLILREIAGVVLSHRAGQLPWLAFIIMVTFLFWFFLGHMIFALFLGLSTMTNVSTSLEVFATPEGLSMLAFGSAVGAVFSTLIFSICVIGLPMLLDREVDFVTAMITSIGAVLESPVLYLAWGAFVGVVTLIAMIPAFLGLFIVLPVFGHASWHLYRRVTRPSEDQVEAISSAV